MASVVVIFAVPEILTALRAALANRMQSVMIFIDLIVGAINLSDGVTNAIEGMTHFVLFATFILLAVLGL